MSGSRMGGPRLQDRDPCPSRWILATGCLLPLVLGVGGCAGTSWGERLSGSFPPSQELAAPTPVSPQAPPPSAAPVSAPTQPAPAEKKSLSTAPSPSPAVSGSSPRGGAALRPSPAPSPAPRAKPSAAPTAPSPYRVTIRLPQVDPSAPAEAVTEALRSAGIPFEVETIERVKGASQPQPPAETLQAPTPGTTVRPAPTPR